MGFYGSNSREVGNASDHAEQDITWINEGLIYWRIYESRSLSDR